MPFVNKNGMTICYEAYGQPKQPCVILIMGITGQLIAWPEAVIHGLVAQGFYVIAFDNRDVGLSSYYDHLSGPQLTDALLSIQQGQILPIPYTLNDMANDIAVLMDGLGIAKAHLVGISMGGRIAQYFALQHAERLLSLTCLATTTGDIHLPPPSPDVLAYFFTPKLTAKNVEEFVAQAMQAYRLYHKPHDRDEEEARQKYQQAYFRAYHPKGNLRQLLATMFATPTGHLLKQVQCPSLVIHGDSDPVFPLMHAEYLSQCLPNSRLIMIPDLGHGMPKRIHPLLVNELSHHFKNKT